MSDVARRPPDAPLTLTPATLAQLTEHPLRMLPESLRPDVLTLWVCHRHLPGLESPMPLAAMLSVWIARHGLRPEDAAAICRQYVAPKRIAEHRFAADLTVALASAAAEAIRRRQAECEAARLRQQVTTPTDAVALRQLLRQIGRMEES
jgi:hypothetical protein